MTTTEHEGIDPVAAAYAALSDDEKPFADVVTAMIDRVPASHRAMAWAGWELLETAFHGKGLDLCDLVPEATDEERTIAYIWQSARMQGARAALERVAHIARQFASPAERDSAPPAHQKSHWGLLVSPGAAGRADLFDATTLRLTPDVAIAGDALTIRTMPNPAYPGETSANAPQQVYEVTRLNRLGLVLVDAEHELFVMTEAEWSSQV